MTPAPTDLAAALERCRKAARLDEKIEAPELLIARLPLDSLRLVLAEYERLVSVEQRCKEFRVAFGGGKQAEMLLALGEVLKAGGVAAGKEAEEIFRRLKQRTEGQTP